MTKSSSSGEEGDRENAPENTIPASESAIAKGADGLELDVHYTTDKELVIHHFFNWEHINPQAWGFFRGDVPLAIMPGSQLHDRLKAAFEEAARFDVGEDIVRDTVLHCLYELKT